MRRPVTQGVLRLVVVCALLGGVILMHHVAGDAAGHGVGGSPHVAADHTVIADHTVAADHAGAGSAGLHPGHLAHAVLHLCVAVLVSVAVAVLGWLLVRLGVHWWTSLLRLAGLRWPQLVRPPRPSGAVLLISLCVMRT